MTETELKTIRDPYITLQSESLFGARENLKQLLVALTNILIPGAPGSNQEAENFGGVQHTQSNPSFNIALLCRHSHFAHSQDYRYMS